MFPIAKEQTFLKTNDAMEEECQTFNCVALIIHMCKYSIIFRLVCHPILVLIGDYNFSVIDWDFAHIWCTVARLFNTNKILVTCSDCVTIKINLKNDMR